MMVVVGGSKKGFKDPKNNVAFLKPTENHMDQP